MTCYLLSARHKEIEVTPVGDLLSTKKRPPRSNAPAGWPPSLTLSGHRVRVIYRKNVKLNGSDVAGWCDVGSLTICINTSIAGWEDTLIHEVVHLIWGVCGVEAALKAAPRSKHEEVIVGIITPHLREAFKAMGWKEPSR